MTHEYPFKPANPSKKGYNKTIDKFPVYVEDPMRQPVRKAKPEGEERPGWKPTHKEKTIPSTSVTTNVKNLKVEFPSVFKR